MGRIGIFVERYTISDSYEMNALMRFSHVARKMGHRTDFLFRPDIDKIPEYDAIYIRALTDPLNSSYVAARTAELNGVTAIDDSDSIRICCDKVNMYTRLMLAGVAIPETIILSAAEITQAYWDYVRRKLGKPVVLKAPNSSFSMYVDRAESAEEYTRIGKRFLRRADRVIAQRFIRSSFDWRVGVLRGKPLYVVQYVIPRTRWKILTYTPEGKTIIGAVKAVPVDAADSRLLERAVQAAGAVGNGLYGVDLKQVNGDFVVIEVNDNPTIIAGDEDKKASDLYERLVRALVESEKS